MKKEYTEDFKKIKEIIEQNKKAVDHILLINLESVLSYHLSLWKQDVLINGGNIPEHLKTVQKVVFYQCMAQDVYKDRYPNMMLEYSFEKIIIALVHFVIFGWEKEENILFNFMEKRFGTKYLNVKETHKHLWFLLELYLQFRNQKIWGTDIEVSKNTIKRLNEQGINTGLIPENLSVYEDVLQQWRTSDLGLITVLITDMSIYHLNLAAEIGQFEEFGDYMYGFYPYEILFLLYVRKSLGLTNPDEFNDYLMNTPEAKMEIKHPEPYPEWDPMLRMIDDFYRENYPEYIPNQYGNLFE